MSFISGGGASAVPGGSSGQVQYNNAGAFAGNAQFVYDGAGTVKFANLTGTDASLTIRPRIGTVLDLPGTLNLYGETPIGGTNGGDVSIMAGDSGVTGFASGGNIGIAGGDALASTFGSGGSISLYGGAASGATGFGGEIYIRGGTASTSGTGGDTTIQLTFGLVATGVFKVITSTGNVIFKCAQSAGAAQFGLYNATPIGRPTTAHAAATFTANAGTAVNDASTFDGYTLKQIVKALRDIGILT